MTKRRLGRRALVAALAVAVVAVATALAAGEPSRAEGQSQPGADGNVQAAHAIALRFTRGGRVTEVLVRSGDHVRRGQVLARVDVASQREAVQWTVRKLEAAKARLVKAKRQSLARHRLARVWSSKASAIRSHMNALDAARNAAEAHKADLERQVALAQKRLDEAFASARASHGTQATVGHARRSLDQARKAAAADAARLRQQVQDAKKKLADTAIKAQASNVSLQAAVDQAQQSLNAAKAAQAQNAQNYQAAVDQAKQALANAQSALSNDQQGLASARSDRDKYRQQVDSLENDVSNQADEVDTAKDDLDACKASPPPEGCDDLKSSYKNEKGRLDDLRSSLSRADSNLAGANSRISSLESAVANDQNAIGSAQTALTAAQQAQSAGLAHDQQTVQAAQDVLASAQGNADSGRAAGQRSVTGAQQTLDSARRTHRSRLTKDQQAVRGAQGSLGKVRGQAVTGAKQSVESARRALELARERLRAGVARDGQSVGSANYSLRSAQQSLSSELNSSPGFGHVPTAGDLAVAELKVELARLAVARAHESLVEGGALRAPIAGTVGTVSFRVGDRVSGVLPEEASSGSNVASLFSSLSPTSATSAGDDFVSLVDLDAPQVEVAFSRRDVAGIRLGSAATASVAELPDEELSAHVVAIGAGTAGVDNAAISYEVTFAVDDPASGVKPGMTASVQPIERVDRALQLEENLRARLTEERDVNLEAHTGLVGIAMQYLGVPYVWGGASPAGGFDCSGLVKFVYAQVGISLPHYAAYQFNYGIPVLRDELEPGDLVFFNGLHHVGMYIGNDEFIQAPHTGDVVKISSLDEPWYATTYAGARRLEIGQRLASSSSAGTQARSSVLFS